MERVGKTRYEISYNTLHYNTGWDINGHVVAPNFVTMEFYKGITGK